MNTVTLDKVDDIHEVFKKYQKSQRYKFRGQSDQAWALVPKAGRKPYTNVRDSEIFRNWKRRAKMYIQSADLNNWDYLAIAQHTGLPTRLLDWSHTPLIAAFFAANENSDRDGAIYVVKPKSMIYDSEPDPFEIRINTIKFVQPATPSSRVINQYSYFSIHNEPTLELLDEHVAKNIEKVIIPKEIKTQLIFLLNHYGVNYLTIYPDLEGLSKHLGWFNEHYEYWDEAIDNS
ncbi:MAG: FRG domain-containing protein [Flavipsychrobacter sp.]|nr:FRG domain-containing protein [Flavipsychrobacter sp.]